MSKITKGDIHFRGIMIECMILITGGIILLAFEKFLFGSILLIMAICNMFLASLWMGE